MQRRVRSWLQHLPAAALALAGIGLAFGLAAGERNPVVTSPARAIASDTGRVIVRYKAGSPLLKAHAAAAGVATAPRLAQALASRHGLSLTDGRMLAERTQLIRGHGIGSAALAAKLAADEDVEWAAVDGRRHALVAPNDALYAATTSRTPNSGQWYLRANGSTVKSSINVEPAWTKATGSGVVVAVLDTGITDHQDLNGKLVAGYDFVGYAVDDVATANDGDLDDSDPHDPGDWITAAENDSGDFEDCGESDSSWHGTQVSGIVAAATGNGVGMAGVARDARILPVRVLGKCGGYDSDIIAGMYWAAGLSTDGNLPVNSHPAQVLNLSLGSADTCTAAYISAMQDMTAAGVVVVAAAGNDGLAVGTPANCPGVVAVAGLRHVGTKVGYSDLGPEVVVSAPGGNCVNETGTCLYPLLSTTNPGTTSPGASQSTYSDGDSRVTLGTSFSSPIVAGTVALMFSANPDLTPAQVTSALRSSARTFPTTGGDLNSGTCQAPSGTPQDSECYCTTSTCGAGMTDAPGAVNRALSGPFPVITPSSRTPVAGASVTLSTAGTSALAGRGIASYQWTVGQGSGLASFTSATNASTATVQVTGAGRVEVKLTLTDSEGMSASIVQPLEVAASALAAVITATPTEPEVGDSVSLSAAGSIADSGRSIASYAWAVTSGSNVASLSGATDAATATLLAKAAGSVTVQLTITDDKGQQASTSRTLTVSPAATSGGGGGGGALAPWWAAGLLLVALAVPRRRLRR
jgi:serine protease